MKDLDTRVFETTHVWLWIATGRLDDPHPKLIDSIDVFMIGRGRKLRKQREIHAEWLISHFPAPGNFLCKQFRRLLCQGSDNAQAAGVGNRRGKFCEANVMHPSLNDGIFNLEKPGYTCLHAGSSYL